MRIDKHLPSADVMRAESYLIARGVRPLALLGCIEASEVERIRIRTKLQEHGDPGAIPFVLARANGLAEYGYAGAAWAVDLLRWVRTSDTMPAKQAVRIDGLLLGYSPFAIRDFEDHITGSTLAPPSYRSAG
jgi:hypothetical protein